MAITLWNAKKMLMYTRVFLIFSQEMRIWRQKYSSRHRFLQKAFKKAIFGVFRAHF